MSQSRDVLELWRRLRQENLFVSAEREGLNRLHNELKDGHYKLLQFRVGNVSCITSGNSNFEAVN
jgi:hypothetical protein